MELHAIEESFNDHKRLVRRFLDGPVNVEQLLRFAETLGQFVFGRSLGWLAGEAACIRNDLAFRVLDRNGNPVRHHAFGAKADAKIHDGFECQPAFGEIRMAALQLVQAEF